MDVLNLKSLDRKFDSVIDCGLFHVLADEDRNTYVDALAHVTKRDGKVFLMCFSDKEPGDAGPRRIREDELRAAFTVGWAIESIAPSQFETIAKSEKEFSPGGPKAWFAIMRRG